jgi:hypothetical protein
MFVLVLLYLFHFVVANLNTFLYHIFLHFNSVAEKNLPILSYADLGVVRTWI